MRSRPPHCAPGRKTPPRSGVSACPAPPPPWWRRTHRRAGGTARGRSRRPALDRPSESSPSAFAINAWGGRLQPCDGKDLLLAQRVLLQQGLGEGLQLGPVLGQESDGFGKTFIGDALDLGIDLARSGFAVRPRQSKPIARALLPERERPNLGAHPPPHHHLVGDHRDLLHAAPHACCYIAVDEL